MRYSRAASWRFVMARFVAAAIIAASFSATAPAADTKPVAFKDDYADVNGVRLHYVSAGKGELVLFVHGYPSFWYQWKDQVADLGRDHLAVAVDTRGYNLSSKPADVDQYKMKYLVEDLRQLAEKLTGKNKKFVLVAHDWGALIAYSFTMYYPELIDRLIIVNGAHPYISEHELAFNPIQRYASNYALVSNNYLAPGEKPANETVSHDGAVRRAQGGFIAEAIKSGRYTEEDRQKWIDGWSQPGWNTAGLNYYRANDRNPPFNDLHPAETVARSWSAKAVTQGAKSIIIHVPTLVIWGMKDTALPAGNLSGIEQWVPNVSVRLYPNEDHWVMIQKGKEVAQDMRDYLDGKLPKDSVFRTAAPSPE